MYEALDKLLYVGAAAFLFYMARGMSQSSKGSPLWSYASALLVAIAIGKSAEMNYSPESEEWYSLTATEQHEQKEQRGMNFLVVSAGALLTGAHFGLQSRETEKD
jgi:hypothetical protein